MIVLYGISNCDTVKKARLWLEDRGIEYRFQDVREQPLVSGQLAAWIDELGVEAIVNKRSTTWRQLPPAIRDALDERSAVDAILANPTLMKRPIVDLGHIRAVGFKPGDYESLFEHHTL